MRYATLIDTTRCVGCRSCQVSCKQWNSLSAEPTQLQSSLGLQNPATLSASTFTLVTSAEIADAHAPGGLRYVFAKRQCMHCDDPACVSACPATALEKTTEGAVIYDDRKCIGCRYCMVACPFGAPTAEWDSLAPKIRKCTLCHDRLMQPPPRERDGRALSESERTRFYKSEAKPACVKQCPAGALEFGERSALLVRARARVRENPQRYVGRIYGEKEAGGTSTFYLSSVGFEQIGFPDVGPESYPKRSVTALEAVPPAAIAIGAALGGAYAIHKRSGAVAEADLPAPAPHAVFSTLKKKLWTAGNVALAALSCLGALCFVARFVLGLGGSTHLSNTYAWGLWIVVDLIWIAVAAGAFAAAGLIYVFQRKELYPMGRVAVLMGLLSYSFVVLTLVVDLGQPWHFWQLAIRAPAHSAMFEVSWCVTLYVTILLLEFLPVPLEHWHFIGLLEGWKKWSPAYVVAAVTIFLWLLSRDYRWTVLGFAVLAFLAWAFRDRPGVKPEPIMLAIAAVVFSTMHQSSLGSLFLLMPDKLDARWWSPILPVEFFVSSIAAGTALLIVVTILIARNWDREFPVDPLAALGQIVFWALLAYEALRVGDLAARGLLSRFPTDAKGFLLAAELAAGGFIPLVLLCSARMRRRRSLLGFGACLAIGGVAFNRANVVLFAMHLKGPMPQMAPSPYWPSAVEWGISAGVVAATIFLFGLGARHLPLLPDNDSGSL